MSQITRAASSHTVVATGWTSPTNAYATTGDNNYATLLSAKNATRSGDFGFADFTTSDIPDGSTINSVTVYVEWRMTASVTGGVLGCQPYISGSPSGTELTKTSTTEEAGSVAFGTVTLSDLRSASTVVDARLRVTKGSTTTAMTGNLDYVYVIVDYDAPPATSANAGVAEGTAAANADTANVSAGGTGAAAVTAAALAGAASVSAWTGYAAATGSGLDATAEAAAGAITFNAQVAEGTALAIAARGSLAASLGFAAGRSS